VVDVTVNDEGPDVHVKLQDASWEINFGGTRAELAGLRSIRDADWDDRRSLHVGRSAGALVHWSFRDETVTIMVGHDDETWDIAVEVPVATVDEIVRKL
jgi:hypothetical protein